jgi:hypothetical protein
MYDMYPWDGSVPPGERSPQTPLGTPHANAVQVALDRRDNGGDPDAEPGGPPAGPTRQ